MENRIVLVKNEFNVYEDKTPEIISCIPDNDGYNIQYIKSNRQVYKYQKNRVKICRILEDIVLKEEEQLTINRKVEFASSIKVLWDINTLDKIYYISNGSKKEFLENVIVKLHSAKKVITDTQFFVVRRKNGEVFNNIKKIFVFDYFYKIIYNNGKIGIYETSEAEISFLYNNFGALEYFKEISKKLISPNEEKSDFLYNQYNKMSIDNKSIFYNYLKNPTIIKHEECGNLIFPFNFNTSQIKATRIGLASNVSVIEGPPGTGKTETILNILMNLIIQRKKVAVVSGNNYAVENINKKLKEYNLDFLLALLGNTDNCISFLNTVHKIPDLSKYALDDETVIDFQNEITEDIEQMEQLLELNNKLANLNNELSAINNEFIYFEDNFKNLNVKPMDFSNIPTKKLSNLIVETYTIPANNKLSFFKKLKLFFKYRFVYFNDLTNETEKIQINLKRYLYLNKKEELEKEISEIKKELENKNFQELNENIKEKSIKILKNFLYNHYKTIGIKKFSDNYKDSNYFLKQFHEFIKIHPVILSTVHSLRKCSSEGFLYDYIIIDEASQTDLVAAGVALSCAKNVIVVGDLKQLSHIVPDDFESEIKDLYKNYNISQYYDYANNNILSSIKGLYPNIEATLLKEHYRCHPKIIGFCNQYFYDNQLIIHTKSNVEDEPLILIESSKGTHTREDNNNKLFNLREVEECIHYEPRINKEKFENKDIGFIAPFNAQVNLAEKHLEEDIFKSTINKFQGQECKIIIFSTVLDKSARSTEKRINFVNKNNLVNVAVSRAKKRFVLVSNIDVFKPGSTIAELTNYMKYNTVSDSIIKSEVYSIFDLMYKEYSNKLIDICVEKIKKVSDIPSENLANYVIDDILKNKKYNFLDSTFSVNLKTIIKDTSLLTEEERRFVYDTSSEVDFVIYNKNNHMPVLLIEVDGYEFHHKPKDKERDEKKNNILNKYNIKFLRLPTESSKERERIVNTLEEIIKNDEKIENSYNSNSYN